MDKNSLKIASQIRIQLKKCEKVIFIDEHKYKDIIENWHKFFKIMKNYTLYIVNFNAKKSIKEKNYPSNYIIGRLDQKLLIVITHDKNIFSVNDRQQQAQICDNNAIFCLKNVEKGIIVSDFLLLFSRLNLLLSPKKQQNQLQAADISFKAVIFFEYGQ